MPGSPYRNKLLQNLAPDVIDRLHLRELKLPVRHEIEYPGSSIDNLYFLEAGIGSMTTIFGDGSQVEVGMFGYEAVMGVSALMGTKRSLNRVYMQLEGYGFKSPIEAAKAEYERHGEFSRLALRYVQAQLTQATQSAGCNAKHSVEQRLARWLLLCADRANSNTFTISQEFLADMLGVVRTSVTLVAHQLREEGLLEYRRSEILIPDPEALEKRGCECYRVVKGHLDNYMEFDTGFVI
jgi:CRP-like cAMP-binding protein